MNAKAKKVVKIVLWTLGILILIPVVLIATLPLWLGPIARPSINQIVPQFTKTSFNIEKLYLNPYTGRFELGDFVMGNPQGYDEPTLAAISNLVFDIAITSLDDKYIHVEDIVVDGLFVSLVKGGENNVDNILQLQYNLAGGKEKYEAKQAASKAASEAAKAADEVKAKSDADAEKARIDAMSAEEREAYLAKQEADELAKEAAAKKLVIDHVLIRNVKIKYGFVTIPVPVTIEMRDLGKKSDGVTISEFFSAVWKEILKSASAVGDGVKALGGLLGSGAGKAGDALGSGAKAVGDGAGKAVDAIKGLFN